MPPTLRSPIVIRKVLSATAGKRNTRYAASVKQQVDQALSYAYVFGTIHHHGSASVGIKLVKEGDTDPDQILKDADAAMYLEKRQGMVSVTQHGRHPPETLLDHPEEGKKPARIAGFDT